LTEPLPVLGREKEGFDHLGADEVAAELVELIQPEGVALEVQRQVGRVGRVAT
jgi:hypothetical protein